MNNSVLLLCGFLKYLSKWDWPSFQVIFFKSVSHQEFLAEVLSTPRLVWKKKKNERKKTIILVSEHKQVIS